MGLEGDQQLVAALLVDDDLIRDLNPVRALEVLHVEDLAVQLGRVVDDDQDLGLRIEVDPWAGDDLLEGVALGHRPRYTPFATRPIRPGPEAGGPLPPPRREAAGRGPLRRSLRAITSWRTSTRRAASCWSSSGWAAGSSSISRSTSASTSSAGSPRARRRSLRACTSWRMSASRSARAAGLFGDGRGPRRAVVHEQTSAAELVEEAEGAGEENRRQRRDHDHDDPDHGAEVHVPSVASAPAPVSM